MSCSNPCCPDEAPESKKVTLTSIDVTSSPTKKLYVVGEVFDPAGMKVQANYSDNSAKELKSGEFTYSPTSKLTENSTKITISYTDGGITRETEIPVQMGYSIEIGESANGTVTGTDRAVAKQVVTLTVKPASDEYEPESLMYVYTESSGEEVIRNLTVSENKTEYTFDMPSYNITVKATFKLKSDVSTYSVTLNKLGTKDNVKVTLSYDDETFTDCGLEKIPADKEINISVKPDSGYDLPELPKVSYSNEDGEQNVDVTTVDFQEGRFSFIMPAANVVLRVMARKSGTQKLSTLIKGEGTVQLSVNGENIPSETYLPAETDVVIKEITPDDDYELTSVKFNNEILSEPYSFTTTNSNSVLEVTFSEKTGYEIVIGDVIDGKLKLSHEKAVAGKIVEITGTPDDGYKAINNLTAVQNDDAKTPVEVRKIDDKYTFTMPEISVTVSADFRGPSITIKEAAGGKITVTANEHTKIGETVTLTANCDTGKALGSIVIKASDKTPDNTRRTDTGGGVSEITFTMPENDVTVDAVFGEKIEISRSVTPTDAGIIELYQGQTFITLTDKMYFAADTEITIKTTAGNIGETKYAVGNVNVESTNGSGDVDVTTVTEQEEYKFTVPQKNIIIRVEFSMTNAKRVHINDVTGGVVVVKVDGSIVTSSSDSWLEGDAYVVDGKTVTVEATPDTGYEVKSLTYNETALTDGSFTMPAKEVIITAEFQKKSYTLNFGASENGTFTLSSAFTYDETKLSASGKTYTNGAKVPFDEIVYLIAVPSNNDYIEQIKVSNKTEGSDIKVERLDKDTKPYQFKMPASDKGVDVKVTFEFKGSDINLFVNGSAVKSFTLNPTPDTATWPTLLKEYYIESEDTAGNTQMGYELKKGDRVQIKDKGGVILKHWEGALGFDETNSNYDVATGTYTAETDGIYKMYYKIWRETDGSKGYSQWIEIPRTAELTNADYHLCVNGQKTKKFSASAAVDNNYPNLLKEFYLKGESLQEGDNVTIETNAATLPKNGILHWEKNNTVGAEDGKAFKVPATTKYDFYFKVWKDGGTSIWVQKSETK